MKVNTIEMMTLNKKNIQYSLRRARPANTAYFLRTSRYQLIVASFPAAHG